MNKVIGRILIGALAVSIPVGGSIFYFATRDNGEDKENEIVDKDDKKDDKDNKGDKKDDNVDNPDTGVKVSNPHKEKIELFKESYQNDEVVGVVSIPNSSLNAVVFQHEDNEYYLEHNVFGGNALEGTVYLDYRSKINSGRKNIIYGHNGDSDKLYLPFSELENFYDKSYYDEHQYILLEDEDGVGKYQIFSVFIETSDVSYMYMNFKSDSSWLEHLGFLKNKSLYDTGVTVDETDEILILQTCSHNENYAKYKDKYFLVVAKRVNYE